MVGMQAETQCLSLVSIFSPVVGRRLFQYCVKWTFIVDHVEFVLSPHQLSALHWAAIYGQVDTIKYLNEKGANLHSTSNGGVSE